MGWISKISNDVANTFKKARPPLKELPAILSFCEAAERPGLSAISLAASIVSRLPELGIDTGVNPDGTPNKVLQFIRMASEQIVKEFQENAKVTVSVCPSSLHLTAIGGNAGGPVTVQGYNDMCQNIIGRVE